MILNESEKRIYNILNKLNKGEIINYYIESRRLNKKYKDRLELIEFFYLDQERKKNNGFRISRRNDKNRHSTISNDRNNNTRTNEMPKDINER